MVNVLSVEQYVAVVMVREGYGEAIMQDVGWDARGDLMVGVMVRDGIHYGYEINPDTAGLVVWEVAHERAG